jgi:hypothetical protein
MMTYALRRIIKRNIIIFCFIVGTYSVNQIILIRSGTAAAQTSRGVTISCMGGCTVSADQ